MIILLTNALIPIFFGLLLGYSAGRFQVIDNDNVRSLITFVMSFAIPCALFLAIARTPRAALTEQGTTAILLTVVYATVYAVCFLWTRSRLKLSSSDSSVVALTMGFPNSAAVGLPLLTSVFGAQSKVTVALSLAVGAITVTPVTLAILESVKCKQSLSLLRIGSAILLAFKRPVLWAPVLGIVFSCTGLNLPSFVNRSLGVMGAAADGSALVLTGLVVSAQSFKIGSDALVSVFLKNALQPALALGLGIAMHLSLEQLRFATLICAMPCGFFGVVFGKNVEANPRLASSSLMASYILGVASLAVWIVIVNHLT